MNQLIGALRKALSSGNHPAVVGLVDALLYLVLSFGAVVGGNYAQNIAAKYGHTYLDYGAALVDMAIVAVLCGIMSAVYTYSVHNRIQLIRSVRHSAISTIVAFTAGGLLVTLVVVPLYGNDANPYELATLAAISGLFVAPFGYRLAGFVDKFGIDQQLRDGTIDPTKAQLLLGQDGTAITYTPDSDEKK